MLNWVLVGIGDIAKKRVIPAIKSADRSSLYGVVTRDRAKGALYADRVWTSLDEALTDEAVDAVYIATPVALHASQTIAALRAGKHVLCEKPVAMHYPQAQSMVSAAKASGRIFGVAYYRRTYPKVLRALELVKQGAIGRPVFAEASCHGWFDFADGQRGWLTDPAMAGGGPLYDIGSHRIDLLNYFFGQPKRVVGQLSNVVHPFEVEDSATVLIEYESAVRAVVDVRWHCRAERDEFRITGTDGAIDLSPLNSGRLVHPGGEEHLPPHANLHQPCVQNFVDAVLDGSLLLSTGTSAIVTDWVTQQVVSA
ncbi:MAG: Gfo/Idh/MocA family oxidoreductase [Bryobacterales bacterium]|nr:Gfo/Idh/MocA family oxidoreductase [Bryobacterales bacterium]